MKLRTLVAQAISAALVASGSVLALASPAQAADHDPVVVIPGLFGNGPGAAQVGYSYLKHRLTRAGFEVEVFVAPDYGTGDIHANAERLGEFVDTVLDETGAAKVDVVGHSQGGIVARDYIKTLGGASTVDSLVMYGTPNQGARNASLATAWGFNCLGIVGCQQIAVGSTFLNQLNAGDDSIGDVRYTSMVSRYDTVMTPYRHAFLDAADGNIVNLDVQTQCAWRGLDHMSVLYDAAVIDGVVDALRNEPLRLNCHAY